MSTLIIYYFEIQSDFGIVKNEYCDLSSHYYPNSGMLAKSLIFFQIGENEEKVNRIYDNFIEENLSKYDYKVVKSIKNEVKKEQENLKAFLKHSQILYEKLQKLERSLKSNSDIDENQEID